MIDVFILKDDQIERTEGAQRVRAALDAGRLVWVDLDAPSQDEFSVLDEVFAFHPLTIEDCMQESHHAKVDDYPGYVFTILIAPDKVSAEQEDPVLIDLAAYLGSKFLVTHHRTAIAAISGIKKRLEKAGGEMLSRGVDFLFHDVVDLMVDHYFVTVRRLDDKAETLEDVILEDPRREHLAAVNDLKDNVAQVRRVILDQRMVLRTITREGRALLSRDVAPYFDNIEDHLERLSHRIDLCRETVLNARDLYLSALSNKTSDAMRILTVWATLLLPATVVSGLYGMNLKLPGVIGDGSPWPFWGLLGGTVAVSAGFLAYSRYRKWI